MSATCRPARAFGPVRSRAINMSLLTELSAATSPVLRSSLIQWQCTPALSPLPASTSFRRGRAEATKAEGEREKTALFCSGRAIGDRHRHITAV